MKRALLLGGDGMVGRALYANLTAHGYDQVVAIDNHSRDITRDWVVPSVKLDIADPENAPVIREIMKDTDVVVNLAADVGGVFYNRLYSPAIFAANAALQSIPVAIAEEAGVENFVQISSVCVYEPRSASHKETDDLGQLAGNNWGYSLAKRAGEQVALMSNLPRVTVVRPTNAFGLHDYYDGRAHVIPALIRRAVEPDHLLTVYSPPGVIRTFTGADAMADAIRSVMEHGRDREIYNVGGYITTMGNLAATIAAAVYEITGIYKTVEFEYDSEETGENIRLVNANKLMSLAPDTRFTTKDDFVRLIERCVREYYDRSNA